MGGRIFIYILTLAGLLVPFILITDLYPFFRLGMFAEPASREVQTERFEIFIDDTTGIRKFNTEEVHINPNNLQYLVRNYYYRDEGELFLQKLSRLKPDVKVWHLYRYTPNSSSGEDSTILIRWER